MSRRDFVPFELRERHPEALEEILENRKRINDFWDGISRQLEHSNNREQSGGKFERLKKVRRRSSANIKFQQNLLTTSLHDKHLLHPLGKRKTVWDLFIALLIVYSAVTVPYRIAFSIIATGPLAVVDDLVNYFFLIDILVSFNTAIVDSSTELLVPVRTLIAIEYFKFWFWIDLVSAFPFEDLFILFNLNSGNLDAVVLLKLLRLARVFKLLRVLRLGKFGKQLERLNINPVYFSALRLILVLWFCGHTLACIWIIIGTEASNRTWMTVAPFGDISQYTTLETYGVSFYWVLYTVTSVGYGEFIPVNKLERVFAMILEISGGLIFGAVLAQITRVLETTNPHARAFKQKVEELQSYLQERKLPLALKSKIAASYKYYLRQKSVFDEEMIMRDLPTVMLTKLVGHSYQKQFSTFMILKQLEQSFAVNILVSSKPFQAEHGEVVLSNGAVTSEIVFLYRGLVQFSTVSSLSFNTVTGYCTDGEYFGDFEYYRKTNRFMAYVAKTNCSLFSVDIRAMENAFKLFPVSGKLFHEKVAKRYEHFLRAKGSTPIMNENGVCLREEMWINGLTVRSKHRLDDRVARKSIEIGNLVRRRSSNPSSRYDVDEALYAKEGNVRVLSQSDDGAVVVVGEPSADALLYMGIIPPNNEWKLRWDFFIGLLIICNVIIIPVEVGFLVTYTPALTITQYLIDAIFFLDLLLSSRTAYYDDVNDALVAVPSMILKRYVRTWFAVDFLSCFPFGAVVSFVFHTSDINVDSLAILKVLRLFRVLRAAKFSIYTDKIRDRLPVDSAVLDILKLIVQFLFASHLIACVFWYLTTVFGSHSWYDELGIRDAELQTRYITTLYFIVTTLTGVGYGDISPINPSERTIMTVIFFFGFSIIGFVIANVRLIINTSDASERRVSQKLAAVYGYLVEKKISGSLRELVLNQMNHTYQYGSTKTEREILRVLPQHLVNRIISIHHADTFGKISLFHYIEDDNVVLYLFPMLTSRVYTPGDVVSSQGSLSTDIVFLTKGTVDIVKKWKLPAIKRGRRRSRDSIVKRSPTQTTLSQKVVKLISDMSPSLSRKSSTSDSAKLTIGKKPIRSNSKSDSMKEMMKAKPLSFRGKLGEDEPMYKEKVLTSVRAPDFFGLVSLVTGSAQTATVRAQTVCTTFTLNESDVRSLIVDNPTVALIVKDALAKAYLEQRQRLKNDLRSKRLAFLRECRTEFYDRRDRNWNSGGKEPGAKNSRRSGRRGSFQGRRNSFSQRRGSFNTGKQRRGSFDNSPAAAALHKRASFDVDRKIGVNVLSPHRTRRRFDFKEVAGIVRNISSKAIPFLRGDSEGSNSIQSQASVSQLHPDLLASLQGGRSSIKNVRSHDSVSSGNSIRSTDGGSPKSQPTRQEIMMNLERRGVRKRISPSRPQGDVANRSFGSSPPASPSQLIGISTSPVPNGFLTPTGGSPRRSPSRSPLVARSQIPRFDAIPNLLSEERTDDDEIPPPPCDSPCDDAGSSPIGSVKGVKETASETLEFYTGTSPEKKPDIVEETKDAAVPLGSGDSGVDSSQEVPLKEDTLVSIDERDLPTPRNSIHIPGKSFKNLQLMSTIASSPSSRSGAVSPEPGSIHTTETARKSTEENADQVIDDEASSDGIIKKKPVSRRVGDIAAPRNMRHRSSRLVSNSSLVSDLTSNGIANDEPSAVSCATDQSDEKASHYPSWKKRIRILPRTESDETTNSKDTTPKKSPTPGNGGKSPLTQTFRGRVMSAISGKSPTTTIRSSPSRRLSMSSYSGSDSTSRRRSIGGFAEVVNQASAKSNSGRRTSLTAAQIANTFKIVKKKPPFDPGRVEFGFYDSEDDFDDFDPPIILKSEIFIRRVESAVDLSELDGKTFKEVVKNRRGRRSTFPSNDIDLWKDKKLLELAT